MLTLEQVLTRIILIGMTVLFVWDRLRYDPVPLLILLAAKAAGIESPVKAFVSFGDQIVIRVASVLMLSAAIGASDVIERVILVWSRAYGRQMPAWQR